MAEVIYAGTKYGPALYANALSCVLDRYQHGEYWHGDREVRAKEILDARDEHEAWRFLEENNDHEYEYVELLSVIDRGV